MPNVCECHEKIEGWINNKVSNKFFFAALAIVFGIITFLTTQGVNAFIGVSKTQGDIQQCVSKLNAETAIYSKSNMIVYKELLCFLQEERKNRQQKEVRSDGN